MEGFKYCANCGAKCDADAATCPACGTAAFSEVSADPAANGESGKKGKLNKKWILLMVLLVIGVIASIALHLMRQAEDRGDVGSGEYTKGQILGSAYCNEWANLRIAIPSGWHTVDNPASIFGTDPAEQNTDCGLILVNEEKSSMFYVLIETTGNYSMSDSVVLDSMEVQLKFSDQMTTRSSDRGSVVIAGKTYSYLRLESEINSTKVTVYTYCYVRIKGKRIIYLVLQGGEDPGETGFLQYISPLEE